MRKKEEKKQEKRGPERVPCNGVGPRRITLPCRAKNLKTRDLGYVSFRIGNIDRCIPVPNYAVREITKEKKKKKENFLWGYFE